MECVIRADCRELQLTVNIVNHLVGKKGSLATLKEYWDVATVFEVSVLADDFAKASEAADCMFLLRPQEWMLKSTIKNIKLINDRRRRQAAESEMAPATNGFETPRASVTTGTGSVSDVQARENEQLFGWWVEFFADATALNEQRTASSDTFPVVIVDWKLGSKEGTKERIPAYITVSRYEDSADGKVWLRHQAESRTASRQVTWELSPADIKGVT